MVDFTLQGIIDVIAQTFCGGSTVMAGLLVMVAMFFAIMVVFAAIKAPIHYALVPMILVDIVFTSMGVINTTVSFLIIIVCAVLMARQVRDLVEGSRWRCSAREAGTTASRSAWPSGGS